MKTKNDHIQKRLLRKSNRRARRIIVTEMCEQMEEEINEAQMYFGEGVLQWQTSARTN